MREQRRKLEEEALAERKGREARQTLIEKRRDDKTKAADSRTASELQKDQAADEALLGQTAESAKLLADSVRSVKISKQISLDDREWKAGLSQKSLLAPKAGTDGAAGGPSRRMSASKQPSGEFAKIDEAEDPASLAGKAAAPPESGADAAGWRVDKSGWLLKTASTTKWGQSHKWASRFVVLSGGSLYYFKPQQLSAPAGSVSLDGECAIAKGVLLRSPPSGAFTIALQASAGGAKVRDYPFAAGSDDEMRRWVSALQEARGRKPLPLPPQSAL